MILSGKWSNLFRDVVDICFEIRLAWNYDREILQKQIISTLEIMWAQYRRIITKGLLRDCPTIGRVMEVKIGV